MASSMKSAIDSLQTHFKSLEELPQDLCDTVTKEVFGSCVLSVPVLNYTPTGLVASIRAGDKATIIKITKKEEASWEYLHSHITPEQVWSFSNLLQQDTAQTISSLFGWDYWFKYRFAIVKRAGENNTPENKMKLVFALVAGDALYWRIVSQVYMDAMENETNEVKVLILAKKAQITYSHSEMSLNLLKTIAPCDATATVV